MNPLLIELASGILRPKHQKIILKELELNVVWSSLTLGALWKADLQRHDKALRAVLEQAQGESALEVGSSSLISVLVVLFSLLCCASLLFVFLHGLCVFSLMLFS